MQKATHRLSPTVVSGGLSILSLAVAFVLGACESDSPSNSAIAPAPSTTSQLPDGPDAGVVCADYDNDGFGPGCVRGLDCNDKDPSITDQCYKCNQNAEGCACSTEGKSIACGNLTADATGCVVGKRVCSAGAWSACVADGAGARALPPGWKPKGLGGTTTACQNSPCDPYCQHYPDVPDPSLTNDAGIQGTDSGLQLKPVPIDAGPPQDCVNETAEAVPIPLDIFIMLDRSGSMSGSRWNSVVSAINTFVDSPSAAGIGVGLGLFSYPGSSSCDVNTYATPRVAIATLPGNANAIKNTIGSTSPNTNTPTFPALQGAVQYAQSYATANPTHKVVVVLATDGEPNVCNSTMPNVTGAASAGLNGSPSIPTYVIGVGYTGNLNSIAAAGGSGSAYIVSSGSSSEFLAAMQDIRTKALGCDYNLPLPSTGNIDPSATSVSYRLGTGPSTAVSLMSSQAACGTNNGFYYDDPVNPTKLTLCNTTCNTVKSNASYKVDLTFACKANCGSSSSSVTPIPLDMYVMLDKSGSMSWDGPPSRWTAVTNALKTFVDAPSSAGVGVGLDYFPLPQSGAEECNINQYATPSVGIANLPGSATAIKNSLNATSPGGGTPTSPALQGAVRYARTWATANPTHKTIVVLATDGEPNDCSSSISAVANAAAEGFAGGSVSASYSAVTVGSDPIVDISGSGTPTNVRGDDNSGGPYNIGFPVKFFGTDYTQFWVSTNGVISLGQDCTNAWGNTSIPNTNNPNAMLAAFWDDLEVQTTGNIFYATQGTSPNRTLIVQWVGTRRLGDNSSSLPFEIVLSENGAISYRYGALAGSNTASTQASEATIGFENATGSDGVQHSYDTASISANTSLRWTMSSTTTTYPSIPTYVIGIGSATGNLTQIAASGGSGAPFMVTGGDSSQFLAAMQAIRQQALGCDYNIPPTSLGVPDPDKLSVRYIPGGTGSQVIVPRVSGAGACGSNNGFYFDNPSNPTKLTFCQATCNAVGADMNAQLNIFYDCKPTHPDGIFTRDYSSAGICPPGSSPVWGNWQWTADTPATSHIDFKVSVASTAAGLNSATEYDLLYSDNIAGMMGQPVVAATPNSNGYTNVDKTLSIKGMNRKAPFLRIRAKLVAEEPFKVQTPKLTSWDLGISCEASE